MNIHKYKAVTMVELLAVVSIFLIVMLALAPFVRIAKLRANRMNCANNLRKISLGLHSYALDHNDAFPPNLGALYPNYVGYEGAFDCPATKKIGTKDDPDYGYTAGLTESSSGKEVIIQDVDGNHKRAGKNIVRVSGSVEWEGAVASAHTKP